jgi:hypothetical protein
MVAIDAAGFPHHELGIEHDPSRAALEDAGDPLHEQFCGPRPHQ